MTYIFGIFVRIFSSPFKISSLITLSTSRARDFHEISHFYENSLKLLVFLQNLVTSSRFASWSNFFVPGGFWPVVLSKCCCPAPFWQPIFGALCLSPALCLGPHKLCFVLRSARAHAYFISISLIFSPSLPLSKFNSLFHLSVALWFCSIFLIACASMLTPSLFVCFSPSSSSFHVSFGYQYVSFLITTPFSPSPS